MDAREQERLEAAVASGSVVVLEDGRRCSTLTELAQALEGAPRVGDATSPQVLEGQTIEEWERTAKAALDELYDIAQVARAHGFEEGPSLADFFASRLAEGSDEGQAEGARRARRAKRAAE